MAASKIRLVDLLERGLLTAGTRLIWPRRTATHNAKILASGQIQLSDGRVFATPSGAARALYNGRPVDGWLCWRVGSKKGLRLHDLRDQVLKA